MVTKKRFENRAELLKSNSIRWWPNYQSNSQGIRLLFKLCECTWKKKVQIFFSCWWSWSLIFFGITDALNLFFGRVFWVNMFSFLKSYIHFGWCCWEVLKSTSLRSFQEILRNIGHPNHFLSVFLLISAAIAFAIMWQNFPQQLRLRRRLYRLLHQLCLTLSLLFFEHFFSTQLGNFTFFTTLWMIFRMWPQSSPRAKAWAVRLGKSII